MLLDDPLAAYLAEGGQVGFRLINPITTPPPKEEVIKEEVVEPPPESTPAVPATPAEDYVSSGYSSDDMTTWNTDDWTKWVKQQGMVGGGSPFTPQWGAALVDYSVPDMTGIPQTVANTSSAYNPQQVIEEPKASGGGTSITFGHIDGAMSLNKFR